MNDLKAYGFYSTTKPQAAPETDWDIDWHEEPRSPKKRGRKPTPHITLGMYFDYCAGMTVEEVAAKWGYPSNREVYRRFGGMRLPYRKKQPTCVCRARNPHAIAGVPFDQQNQERTRRTMMVRRPEFEAALEQTGNPRWRNLLELRLSRPELSLAALGDAMDPPMSKHAVSSILRRATEKAS